MADLTPITREEKIIAGEDVKPVTREEKILAGMNIVPVTRREKFLKAFGGGGSGGELVALIDRSITEITSDIESVGMYAFHSCYELKSANFANATLLAAYAFSNCRKLKTANFPKVASVGQQGFASCYELEHIKLPLASTFGQAVFSQCRMLKTIDLPSITTIAQNQSGLFSNCNSLTALILRSQTLVSILTTTAYFSNCYHFYGTVNSTYNPDGLTDGYIYVPAALVEKYKSHTYWSDFGSRFRALEDYTVDGTITGELDETKI